MHEHLVRIAGVLKSALFPNRCLACEAPFFHAEGPMATHAADLGDLLGRYQALMAPFLCGRCIQGFLPVTSPKCPKCGVMFQVGAGDDHWCGGCLEKPGHFQSARAAGVYDLTLKAAIHALKYRGKTGLAKPLGQLLFGVFLRQLKKGRVQTIVPVPLHREKMRQRGFNQAFLLIRQWEKLSASVPGAGARFRLDRQSLIRTRQTAPQAELNRKERQANIRGAFNLVKRAAIADKQILLVDDVYTTGATVDECARVLLNGGAKRVDVLTLARAR